MLLVADEHSGPTGEKGALNYLRPRSASVKLTTRRQPIVLDGALSGRS